MEQGDADVTGLDDLVVAAEGWLVDDESELGPVDVGQTLRHYVGIWSREWTPATEAEPSVVWVEGETSRVTGRVGSSVGVFDGFDILCGPARFWMFTGAYDLGPPLGYVPPITEPPHGSWVTVEGRLYVRPWYEVTDGAGMSERDMETEAGWPTSCDWVVRSVADGSHSWVLHLAARPR